MLKCIIYISLLFFSVNIFAQGEEQIKQKQGELSDIKKEISELEAEIKSKTKKEKESYSALENYNKQNFLLNKVINNLRSEEIEKGKEINQSINKIGLLEKEIKLLRENYSKYIVAIYKNGKINELAGLFDAESIEQALLRYKYLQKFSDSRQKDLMKLKTNKEELALTKKKLEQEREEKHRLVLQKNEEEKKLHEKLAERKSILNVVKNDKAALKKELDGKRNAETTIKNLITRLIEEEERKRKEEEARLARLEKERLEKNKTASIEKKAEVPDISSDYNLDLSTSGFASFSALRGRLNWPLLNGKIIRKFGENKNLKLNTVTLNYGVDILAKSDLNVKAVAEGVISAIDWIPGYGSVIIITHRDQYRTVYSHLSEIFVKEGDKVKMGSLIAKVGESLEGNVLHFEIWNSRENQNPENWFAKK